MASLSPDWIASKLHELEYARYSRFEIDGSKSTIVASRQVCDCQPAVAMQMLVGVLSNFHGVSNQRDTIVVCGQTAERNIATGLSTSSNTAKNIETIMFRSDGAIYTLTYTFRSATPLPSGEAALTSLCPPPSKPAP
jgi:hypothetical protein